MNSTGSTPLPPSSRSPQARAPPIALLPAVILTATSFWVANTSAIWPPGVRAGLAVLAIAQTGVHLVFFLHITTGPDNTNNILALAFGVLLVFLVLIGSLVIMADLKKSTIAHAHLSMLHLQFSGHAGQPAVE
jgi:cytochrome o ubiquinol oxidase subunit IV